MKAKRLFPLRLGVEFPHLEGLGLVICRISPFSTIPFDPGPFRIMSSLVHRHHGKCRRWTCIRSECCPATRQLEIMLGCSVLFMFLQNPLDRRYQLAFCNKHAPFSCTRVFFGHHFGQLIGSLVRTVRQINGCSSCRIN